MRAIGLHLSGEWMEARMLDYKVLQDADVRSHLHVIAAFAWRSPDIESRQVRFVQKPNCFQFKERLKMQANVSVWTRLSLKGAERGP